MWVTDTLIWLEMAGHRLEGRCWGPPPDQAPTLVLLHEGLGSVSLWRDFPARLAAETGLGVFAYSRCGYGRSDPAPLPRKIDYMTDEAVQALPMVLDAIGFRSGVLIGHSDGASIAAIHAGLVRDARVKALVLMAPHFFTEAAGLASIRQAKQAFETTDLRDRLARHHQDPDCAFRGWNDAWLNPDFAAWNIEHVIDGITVPVLAIQGQDDQYGSMAQLDVLADKLNAAFSRCELAACQHAPQFEQPERCMAEISRFLRNAI